MKSRLFQAENNTYFLNNTKTTLKKFRERLYWSENGPLKCLKWAYIFTKNLYCWGHLLTFKAKNTHIGKAESNA